MEAPQLDPGRDGKRRCGGSETLHSRLRTSVSGPSPPVVHRTGGALRMRVDRNTSWGTIGASDYIGVRSRRRISTVEDPLNLVACDRWVGERLMSVVFTSGG